MNDFFSDFVSLLRMYTAFLWSILYFMLSEEKSYVRLNLGGSSPVVEIVNLVFIKDGRCKIVYCHCVLLFLIVAKVGILANKL